MNDKESAFPYNLLEKIGISKDESPKDAEATLYYTMFRSQKNKMAAEMTLMHYRDCLTLQEIADAYLLSLERIYTIISNFIQKMQAEDTLQILRKGIYELIEEEKMKAFYFGKGEIAKARTEQEQHSYENQYHDSVHHLNISAKAKNALLNNDTRINGILMIATVGDIIALGSDGLMRVKRIGKKLFQEITDVLINEYGENPDNWRWKTYCKQKTENRNNGY